MGKHEATALQRNASLPILVIRYKEEFVIGDIIKDAFWQWAICKVNSKREIVPFHCTKEQAMKIIERDGMERVYRDKNGSVFSTPDELFKDIYADNYSGVARIRQWFVRG